MVCLGQNRGIVATCLAAGLGLHVLFGLSCKRPVEPATSAPATLRNGPNVVLITLDTTRADHLGCYGYGKPVSPRIDGFAERATLFDNAICSAAVTPVSHASILTGLYPYSHGLRVLHGLMENRLPDEIETLAEVLKDGGYQTAAFISAFPAGSRFGLAQGFDVFNEDFMRVPPERIITAKGTVKTDKNQRHAGETTDLALEWLAQARRPCFLWLHYFDPHDPKVRPPEEFFEQFSWRSGTIQDQLRAIYDIEIRYMDQQLGRVLDALEETGWLEETIVVIVSDHGEGLGDHNWWTHGILYQEQIWAPLIIRAPGQPSGRRVGHLVRTIDIMPTVLELVGLDPEDVPSMDGHSLVPMLAGDTPDPKYTAYADSVNMLTYRFARGITDEKNDMLFSVTAGPWKYIHHLKRREESELYNLAEDPAELNNLYAREPDRVRQFLRDLKERDFVPDLKGQAGRMSAEDIERLRSLGYVN